MRHPCIVQTTQNLDQLRQAVFKGIAQESALLSPGFYFCWDIANGDVDVVMSSTADNLLRAEVVVSGAPRWFTFNISLGAGPFSAGDTLGLVVKGSLYPSQILLPFVRSVEKGSRHDTPLADVLKLGSDTCTVDLLHTIESHDPISWADTFHTLILPLPKQNFTFDLIDMRLFHVGASVGLKAASSTIGSLAH